MPSFGANRDTLVALRIITIVINLGNMKTQIALMEELRKGFALIREEKIDAGVYILETFFFLILMQLVSFRSRCPSASTFWRRAFEPQGERPLRIHECQGGHKCH